MAVNDTPDGQIANFKQGAFLNDSWYLASIKALGSIATNNEDGSTSYGVDLAKSITISGDNYTVAFAGSNYTYKTTKAALQAEIKDVDKTGTGHSSGDADVVLLEMALKDFYAKANSTFKSNPTLEGSATQALGLLSGGIVNTLSVTKSTVTALTEFFSQNMIAPKVAKSAAASTTTIAAKMKALGIVASKSYYISEYTDGMMTGPSTVTLINPSDTSKSIKLSLANFKLYFTAVDYVSVDWQNPGKTLITANASGSLQGGTGFDILIGGNGNDTLRGGESADSIMGGAGANELYGDEGNDTIRGGTGNDKIYGGDGMNSIYGGAGNDLIDSGLAGTAYGEAGNDTMTGGAALYGGDGNDSLTGTDYLNGGAGNDTIVGNDYLEGGAGNDVYYISGSGAKVVDSAGIDAVYNSYQYVYASDYTGVEKIYSTASNVADGKGIIEGGGLNDYLVGGSGEDSIDGGYGNDTLDGGLGSNYLEGGSGNDTYVINSLIGDTVYERREVSDGGIDTALTMVESFVLNPDFNIENLTLGGTVVTGTANDKNNIVTGNASNNMLYGLGGYDKLYGLAGNDTLDGGVTSYVEYDRDGTNGIDTLYGGAGNDTYIINYAYTDDVNNAATGYSYAVVDETIKTTTSTYNATTKKYVTTTKITDTGGIDTVVSSLSNYTLGSYVENLTLAGTSDINGTGNSLNNTLKGNIGDNNLKGSTGNDTIIGGGGDDTLDGGVGLDSLSGGAGNDTYVIDNVGDKINLTAETGGSDVVLSSVSYTLATGLDNLTLTGSTALKATGNSAANVLKAHKISSTTVGDTLSGGAGDDVYYIYNTKDVVDETKTTVTKVGTKTITTVSDSGGNDTVVSSFSYSLGANAENLTLLGLTKNDEGNYTDNINATGNSLNNLIVGNSGRNIITGGKGDDTLQGGDGGDTYNFASGDGKDTVTDTSMMDFSFLNTYKFAAGITTSDIFFYRDDSGNIIVDYTKNGVDNDVITVMEGNTGSIELSSGQYTTLDNLNNIIELIGAYAGAENGIDLTNHAAAKEAELIAVAAANANNDYTWFSG